MWLDIELESHVNEMCDLSVSKNVSQHALLLVIQSNCTS